MSSTTARLFLVLVQAATTVSAPKTAASTSRLYAWPRRGRAASGQTQGCTHIGLDRAPHLSGLHTCALRGPLWHSTLKPRSTCAPCQGADVAYGLLDVAYGIWTSPRAASGRDAHVKCERSGRTARSSVLPKAALPALAAAGVLPTAALPALAATPAARRARSRLCAAWRTLVPRGNVRVRSAR